MGRRSETDSLRLLDEVFTALPPGGAAPPEDRLGVEGAAGLRTSTYGEILPAGTALLARWLALQEDDVVFDLGSGVGRMPLQLAATTDLGLAVGVELSPWRHAIAERARDLLDGHLPEQRLRERVRLELADAREVPMDRATVIFLGATCFDDGFCTRVVRQARAARDLRAFLCTRAMPGGLGLRERASVHVPMTWAPRVRVHVYDLP